MSETVVNNFKSVNISDAGMISQGSLDFDIEKQKIMSEIMDEPEFASIAHETDVTWVNITTEEFGKFCKIMNFYKYYSGDIKITMTTRAENPGLIYIGQISHEREPGTAAAEKARAKLIYEPSLATGEQVVILKYRHDNPKQLIKKGLGSLVFVMESDLKAFTHIKFEPCQNFKMYDCTEPTRDMKALKVEKKTKNS